jgi:hypothetical protein
MRHLIHGAYMTEPITARRSYSGRRAPKQVEERRVCAHTGCVTVLSRYNRRPTCHVHAPIRFPRIRGREAPTPS